MANFTLLTDVTRNKLSDEATAQIDLGAGAGKARIYTTGKATLLCEVDLNATNAFNASVAGVAPLNTSVALTGSPVADGTAAECYFTDSDDNEYFAGNVNTTDGFLVLGSTTISIGVDVTIISGNYTTPAGSVS